MNDEEGTEFERSSLIDLISSPGWKILVKELDRQREESLVMLLNEDIIHNQDDSHRTSINMIDYFKQLPGTMIAIIDIDKKG